MRRRPVLALIGLLALSGVPPAQQGAAAGMFFAWFDAGVGLGGPAVGAVASLTDAGGALDAAGVAVAAAALIGAIVGRPSRRRIDRWSRSASRKIP